MAMQALYRFLETIITFYFSISIGIGYIGSVRFGEKKLYRPMHRFGENPISVDHYLDGLELIENGRSSCCSDNSFNYTILVL